jgi:hypothetical protein
VTKVLRLMRRAIKVTLSRSTNATPPYPFIKCGQSGAP